MSDLAKRIREWGDEMFPADRGTTLYEGHPHMVIHDLADEVEAPADVKSFSMEIEESQRARIEELESALREIVDSFDPYDPGRQASRLAKIASDALNTETTE